MNIIEELGITPIDRLYAGGVKRSALYKFVCVNPVKLTEIENQYNEMLEALIDEWIYLETFLAVDASIIDRYWYKRFSTNQHIIAQLVQKATGKTWKEIKELLS